MSAVAMTYPDPAPLGRLARLRAGAARVGATGIAGAGFVAGLTWAFVGSLLLDLGSVPQPNPAVAWAWLGGEVLIGATTFASLLLTPSARREQDSQG
jgi:hypothetical protein